MSRPRHFWISLDLAGREQGLLGTKSASQHRCVICGATRVFMRDGRGGGLYANYFRDGNKIGSLSTGLVPPCVRAAPASEDPR